MAPLLFVTICCYIGKLPFSIGGNDDASLNEKVQWDGEW